jgi:hypothetical protein
MILKMANTKEEKEKVRYISNTYHSYVPSDASVGRRIDFLIYDEDYFTLLGAISGGSSVYPPPKDLLIYLGKTKNEYKSIFNQISVNRKFCLIYHKKNLGTQILKKYRNQMKIEWKKKYGDELKYIITFVGDGHDGAIYKADNWQCIGKTSGLPPHKSSSMKWNTNDELKETFVKPIGGELQKLIFIKEL